MKTTMLVLTVALLATVARAADLPSKTDESLLKEVARSQQRGLDWLLKKQMPDGSWNAHPAITGLAITAIQRSGKTLTPDQQDAIDRGAKFILSNVKSNGAIFGGGETDKYPNYSTAICTMALLATGKAEYHDTIAKARVFLLDSQFDEMENTSPDNPSFGGIGYGRRQRPDLSNMAWALEALKLTEAYDIKTPESPQPASQLHWQRAVLFLQRCQNLPSANDQPWAKNAGDRDLGGFIYMPGHSEADENVPKDEHTPLRSYGSMSYAGLKSYIYADVKKDDPRVASVMAWLKHNYSVEENPALGPEGLYYYYVMLTKALTAYGDDTVTDAAGKTHDWRYELMKKLVTLQKADGFWQNENNRWWENDPVLVTTYSLITIEILQKRVYP